VSMIMKAMGFDKVAFAVAVCGLTWPVMADDMVMTNAPAAMITPADFAWDAGLINLEEIRLGEVAQSNSQNTAVQDFGQRMVRDHSRLNARLMRIAAAEGLQLPDTNTFYVQVTEPEKPATELMEENPQEKLLNAQLDAQHMASLTGTAFDQAYADAMVKGHEKAIQEFEDASASLDDKPLKKYADKGLNVIRHHYEMAQQLQSEVTGTNGSSGNNPPM
jgi:putative membrane protein